MEKQKNWIKRHPVWTGIIGFFILLFIIGIFVPESDYDANGSKGAITGEVISGVSSEEPKPSSETIEVEIQEEIINSLYTVTKIIDGDTIEINTGERVRLICIDTPERGEDYYSEASNYLAGLVLNKEVELIKDISEKDRYGRLLRYIYFEGDFVNELIVYNGYGKAYPYSPDTSKCPIIQEAEQHAKTSNLGMWGQTNQEQESTPSDSNIVCSSDSHNCGDFSSCSEVMEVFNACSSDIHKLDKDGDGIPCESLCG